VRAAFGDLGTVLEDELGQECLAGFLFDLGVSSPQLDRPDRGFSYREPGPLDMRMDQTQGRSAADWVNEEDAETLANVIYQYGEERRSRRIARAIVEARKTGRIERTLEFAAIVEKAVGGRRDPTHPATKTFQALRMAVNAELESLEAGLESGLSMLCEGGRMTVITFHSLEDRIVKNCFKRHTVKRESLQQGGEKLSFEEPAVRLINRKPLTATKDECSGNPRARSAKLRAVEREKAA
jgi:16S rRNA (cytosine1402-N4)-methyltransferase